VLEPGSVAAAFDERVVGPSKKKRVRTRLGWASEHASGGELVLVALPAAASLTEARERWVVEGLTAASNPGPVAAAAAAEAFGRASGLSRQLSNASGEAGKFVATEPQLFHDEQRHRWLATTKGQLGREAHTEAAEAVAAIRARWFPGSTTRHRLPGNPAPIILSSAEHRSLVQQQRRLQELAPQEEGPALQAGAAALTGTGLAAAAAEYEGAGVAVVDGLLSPAALAALRNFCNEATGGGKQHQGTLAEAAAGASGLFADGQYKGGYVGATLRTGFGCPLVLQIACELREALPELLAEHPLREAWAFRYDSRPPSSDDRDEGNEAGISVHADSAAVNVNLWLTREQWDAGFEGGGLLVWRRGAPAEWDFEVYNRQPHKIKEFLAECEPSKIRYRQNRAVIFDANLFHQTEEWPEGAFGSEFPDRRVNVTLLFGDRIMKPKKD
jgi:hypothetical protein